MSDHRRCTSEACYCTANRRAFSMDMPIANILHSPRKDWNALTKSKIKVARSIEVDWAEFGQSDFLFSHASIVASVKASDNGYYIESPSDELVNNNGNAWTNEVLLAAFRSFIGAENYYEHVQVPELSKGKILDAVVRPVQYTGKNGKETEIYYVDILVATNRKHDKLVNRIEAGELTTMSMGCIANVTTCSRCGHESSGDDESCEHVKNEILQYFKDEDGKDRITAELCGRSYVDDSGNRVGDPESIKFIEASWVENPAFSGAVLNHYISEVPKNAAKLLNMPTLKLEELTQDMFKLRVADKDGKIALKVALDEIKRRKQESIIDRVGKHFQKEAASMTKHIRALQKLFPKSMVRDSKDFHGRPGGIWTGFGEDGTSDYPDDHHPKLQKYMDKNKLFAEWYDSGTLMIWPI